MTSNYHGFVNLLKPPGLTSHDAVSKIRRLLRTRSVGHAGTLDPAASGVLPLAVGRGTRLLEYLVAQDKLYVGEVTFGIATDTLDQQGKIVWRATSPPVIGQEELQDALLQMVGLQQQIPPAFSAIKHAGRPLYSYARAGESVVIPARQVQIYSLDMICFEPSPWPRLLFRVCCSKGTYVRSLARDLAAGLGTQGTLTFLLREAVGDFSVQSAHTLEEITYLVQQERENEFLLPLATAVEGIPHVELSTAEARRFLYGQRVPLPRQVSEGPVAVFGHDRLLGIGKFDHGNLAPRKVLAKWEEIENI
jgi:tRNA pseudouridine55 synthase